MACAQLGLLVLLAAPWAPVVQPARHAWGDGGDSLRVPILVYHNVAVHHPGDTPEQRALDVSPETFAWQMAYLQQTGTSVISLARLAAALEGRDTVPEHAVVLTFDDGWETQFIHVFPVLRRLGYTATFFVFTAPIGRGSGYMTWDELRELTHGGMTVGSHSLSHPFLPRLHDPALIRREIAESREILEDSLGVPVEFFAYPYGAFSSALEGAVRDAGYRAARSFPGGAWNGRENIWALRAVEVTEDPDAFRHAVGAEPVDAKR